LITSAAAIVAKTFLRIVRFRTDSAIAFQRMKEAGFFQLLERSFFFLQGGIMDAGPAAASGAPARILIVDDNPDAVRLLAILLQRSGYQVEIVIDATRCLARLAAFNPDVVLLDLAMPKVSGYDLAKQIRACPQFENVIILAVSGYADPKHARLSLEAGCDRHLAKPVDLDALLASIAKEVQKRLATHLGVP
jgi:CheY-like chemotaxis protein